VKIADAATSLVDAFDGQAVCFTYGSTILSVAEHDVISSPK